MMNFPLIQNISDILPAIQGKDEFIVAEKEGYVVVNYNVMFEDTFQDPEESGISEQESLYRYLRREARGIIFDTVTGDIIRRPFHKFKNVNEAPETQDHVIDLSQPHVILEKLDGSMISPFIVGDRMIWGTKMGDTCVAQPVHHFVSKNPKYINFASWMFSMNFTPIFEWCSRKQRIVLDYEEDQLILTAIRHLHTGEYVNFQSMCGFAEDGDIPIVRAFEPQSDMKAFREYVHDLEDMEGFVIRFDSGQMLKLKCSWYIQIHKAKEAILQDRNIVELILEEHLDDVKAHLPVEDRDRLTRFEHNFWFDVKRRTRLIAQKMQYLRNNGVDRKTFAIDSTHSVGVDAYSRPIIFKNFDGEIDRQKIEDDVRNMIRNNLSRTVKYEAIRDCWFRGVVYNA